MFYIDEKYDPKPILTYWQRCGQNDTYPRDKNRRKDKNITCIYHQYHFNPGVKQKGMEKEEFPVEKSYVRAVSVIQKEMQKDIRDRGIGIETNPSSNYLIGCFRSYWKHPLIAFFNLGLTADSEEIKKCPQLFVSVNTDDQGVFNTYLEKEYALMALALENVEDRDGNKVYNSAMIYDWLDRIRQMGLEQSFVTSVNSFKKGG
jgi:exonuclease V gamma subunit